MKVIFLGKHVGGNNNCLGINALQYLIQILNPISGSKIECVTSSKDLLFDFCKRNNINVTQNIDDIDLNNIDLVISYGWGEMVKGKLLKSPRIGCINLCVIRTSKRMGGIRSLY